MTVPSFLNIDDFKNKNVLVRVDFNVPVQDGIVQDLSRIKNIAPTIKFLRKANAKIILISHIGKTQSSRDIQSLQVVVDKLSEEYKSNVVFIEDCLSEKASDIINQTSSDNLILLENLRCYKEEESCDRNFACRLAALADCYINEAFSVSHRKHASVYELPKLLPHAIGIAFAREIKIIDDFLSNAKSPKMAIVGGAKLSTKIKLLKNLVQKVDKLALGGGIAEAFLAFHGNNLVRNFNVEEYKQDITSIIDNARKYNCELILPVDFSALVNNPISDVNQNNHAIISPHERKCCDEHICENGQQIEAQYHEKTSIFDIGPASIELFKKHLHESATLLWNGPVGLFEKAPFDFGTMSLAKEVAKLSKDGRIVSIVGGGDTAFAMNKFGVSQYLTYQSTSGGAFLTYLEGGELPGLTASGDVYLKDIFNNE